MTCKHVAFCNECDTRYNVKNSVKKECPICRKEYKKTIKVLFT